MAGLGGVDPLVVLVVGVPGLAVYSFVEIILSAQKLKDAQHAGVKAPTGVYLRLVAASTYLALFALWATIAFYSSHRK